MWRRIGRTFSYFQWRWRTAPNHEMVAELPDSLQQLFWTMHPADQAHCIRAAVQCRREALRRGMAAHDRERLEQAALVHDVGKGVIAIGLGPRLVSALPFIPGLQRLFMLLRPNGAEQLMVLADHAQLGANLLARAGCAEAVVELVANHHEPALDNDVLAGILQRCDNGC